MVGVVGLLLFGAISAAAYFVFMSKATSKQINSIAVLPFQNKGGDADTDYLSDGLAESLIFRLSQLPGLKVSPTSSVMRYKGTEMDVSKIARELGVDAVMSGRLVKRGENLNITVELVDTRNNKTLWGEQYERKMSDLLATHREIATAITEKLQLKLSGDDAKGVTKRYTDNNEAYQAYLKGRYYWKQRGGKNLNTGIGYFQEAIRMDPGFALAWSGLADSYVLLPEYTTTSVKEAMPKAKEAAEKAIALDPQLAEAHASVGYVKYAFEWDFAGAEKEFRQAIDLDPKYTTAHQWYGELLCWLHRYDEATAQTRIAVELEPLSALQKYIYAIPFVGMRKYDDADKAYGEALELDRGFGRLQAQMAQNEIAMGRFSEAQKSCEAAIAIDAQLFKYCPAAVYAASADKAKAYALLAEPSNSGLLGVWDRALVYSLAGDKDKAFEALNTLYEERAASVVYISALPGFDNLRGDPRYKELMKKVGLPE